MEITDKITPSGREIRGSFSLIPEDVHVLEYMDKIDEMYDNQPDKRTKEYKEWKKELNELVDKVNVWAGKIYNRAK